MYGKLGHGNEAGHSTPKRVEALVGLVVSQIVILGSTVDGQQADGKQEQEFQPHQMVLDLVTGKYACSSATHL